MKNFFTMRHCSSKRSRRGTSAIECAFVLPILLLISFGVFEFGRAMWVSSSIQESLNVTGRYAMYNPTASNAQLLTYFGTNIHAVPSDAVTLGFANSTTGTVTFTTITATYNFSPVSNIIPSLAFTLTSTVRVPRV